MQVKRKVLVADDESALRDSLCDWLTNAGFEVLAVDKGEEALEVLRKEKPAVAVINLILPGSDGLEILNKARKNWPNIQIIVLAAYSSVNTAVAAFRGGACDYIEKPFSPEKLGRLIADLAEKQSISEEIFFLQQKVEEKYSFDSIVARSSRMRKIIDMSKVVARSNAPVLISGESGTGKELVARIIHAQGFRKDRPFAAVSCAHLPGTSMESELFGHESGAFNGAQIRRKGKFEIANQGTLFLDEVGDLDQNVQVQLLRTLEEKTFSRVGSDEPIRTEARLISATNKDLKKAIESGRFREDLYYRLSVVNIELPPLRDRKEDIPFLAQYFLKKFNEDNQKEVADFSPEAIDFLLKYEWSGNIREMENAIERAVILAKNDRIELTDLFQQNVYLSHKAPIGKTMREIEKNHILNVLNEAEGNCSEAARLLGISRMTLYNKIKAYSLNINKVS